MNYILIMGLSITTTVLVKEQLTDKVYRFSLARPADWSGFVPGQFLSIEVARATRRSYSITSGPNDPNLELLVDVSPLGPGSRYFLDLQVGDTVKALGPLGNFHYRAEEDYPVHFYATGTGVAPLIVMAEHALFTLQTKRQVELYFGVRYEQELFWLDRLARLTKAPNFQLHQFVSQSTGNWQGRSGYVNQNISSITSPLLDAYICGSKKMITDTKQRLLDIGVPPVNIFTEQYY